MVQQIYEFKATNSLVTKNGKTVGAINIVTNNNGKEQKYQEKYMMDPKTGKRIILEKKINNAKRHKLVK